MDKRKSFEILLSDLWLILKRRKKSILLFSIGFMTLLLYFVLDREVMYTAEGTFRDKGRTEAGFRQSMSDLILGGASDKNDSEAVSAMKSSRLMESIIKELDLQASINERATSYPFLRKIKNHLQTEYAHWTKRKTPLFDNEIKPFAIRNLSYSGETILSIPIYFLDENTYALPDGEIYLLGSQASYNGALFSLERTKAENASEKIYDLNILPLKKTAKDYSKLIQANLDTDDRTLIKLSYSDVDRHRSAEFINGLMLAYQRFLEEEHNRISAKQLAYLKKREGEIGASLQLAMEDHAAAVSKDVHKSGFTNTQREIDFLAGQLAQITHKLMEIDLEKKRLENAMISQVAAYDPYSASMSDARVINELLNKIRELKLSQDSLALSLQLDPTKMADQKGSEDYKGITLETAKSLYVQLAKDRQETETMGAQLKFVFNEIDRPDFEISSLTTLLPDPVSQEKIQKGSQLSQAIKETSNRSNKEIERLKEDLQMQKDFLKIHISESEKLLALKGKLLGEKDVDLKRAMLEMTHRELTVLEKQMLDYLSVRLINLKIEEDMLLAHQEKIKNKMGEMPEKWIQDQLLEQHLSRNQKMVESITSMVESKNISSNLELIQSAPLDYAVAPLLPKPPRLILFSLVGLTLGAIFSSLFFVSNHILNAIPLSLQNLSLNGFHTLGKLIYKKRSDPTPLFDQNLETLRKIAHQIKPDDCFIALLPGSGSDFTYALKDILLKQGKNVIHLDLTFKNPLSKIGLKQYIEGEATLDEIIHDRYIASGGVDRYHHELISSEKFENLLHELGSRYDIILANSEGSLSSSTSLKLLKEANFSILQIINETESELSNTLNLIKENNLNAAFVLGYKI